MISGKTHFKAAAIKAAIVLVPSYSAAYLTEKMVWVVPTMAAAGFFAGTIQIPEQLTQRRLDESEDDSDDQEQQGLDS